MIFVTPVTLDTPIKYIMPIYSSSISSSRKSCSRMLYNVSSVSSVTYNKRFFV